MARHNQGNGSDIGYFISEKCTYDQNHIYVITEQPAVTPKETIQTTS